MQKDWLKTASYDFVATPMLWKPLLDFAYGVLSAEKKRTGSLPASARTLAQSMAAGDFASNPFEQAKTQQDAEAVVAQNLPAFDSLAAVLASVGISKQQVRDDFLAQWTWMQKTNGYRDSALWKNAKLKVPSNFVYIQDNLRLATLLMGDRAPQTTDATPPAGQYTPPGYSSIYHPPDAMPVNPANLVTEESSNVSMLVLAAAGIAAVFWFMRGSNAKD